MHFRRAWAIIAAALFLLPLAPAGAAESASCETEECRSIALFVQGSPQGLSSLPGDGMPSDPTTRATSISARTLPLQRSLDLDATGGTFRFVAPNANAWPHVNATYSVHAVDLLGRSTLLGSHRVEAIRPSVTPEDVAAIAFNTTAGLVGPLVNDISPGSIALLEGNVARAVVNASTDALCAVPSQANDLSRAPCQNLNGDVGHAGNSLRPRCSSANGPRTGSEASLQEWVAWWAMRSWDEHRTAETQNGPRLGSVTLEATEGIALPIPTDEKLCRSRHDDLNATASQVPAEGPGEVGVGPLPFPDPPASMPALGPRNDWRDVTFNLTQEHGFPTRGDFVTIPSGYRLQFFVNATIALDLRSGPVEFEFGRADALTRLEIRTPTDAFLEFAAGREAIGPGRHTGVFSNLTDTDLFSLRLAEGETFDLVPGANVAIDAWTPSGAFRSLPRNITGAGDWTLSARRASQTTTSPPGEYTFELRTPPVAPEAIERIEPGTHVRSLGPGDDRDVFTFFAWHGQAFSIEITPGAGLATKLESAHGWDTREENLVQGRPNTFFAPNGSIGSSGMVEFAVTRVWGADTYEITLWRNETWNLTNVPALTPLWTDPRLGLSLTPYRGGVDHSHSTAFEDRIVHTDPENGTVTVVAGAFDGGTVPRDAQGEVFAIPSESGQGRHHEMRSGGHVPLARMLSPVFGPDGALYFKRGVQTENGSFRLELARMWPDRSIEASAVSGLESIGGSELAFAPSGELFFIHPLWDSEAWGATPLVVDFEGGTLTPSPIHAGLAAFDGVGGFYRVTMGDVIEHVTAGGVPTLIAWTPSFNVRDLAATEDRLFVSMLGFSRGIAWMPVPAPGFEGSHPELDFRDPPDLLITNVSEEVELQLDQQRERHILHVTVRNDGPTASDRFRLDASGRAFFTVATSNGLAPAASAILTVAWDAPLTSPGDHEVFLLVDREDLVAEGNETNNHYVHRSTVLVGGHHQACLGLTGQNLCRIET